MKTHTRDFKEEIKRFGRSIKGKIIYYPSYDLVSESDDNILTENDLHLISEQANYGEPIEIREEDIFSINIIKNGDLLQSLMKEFDFETKIELNIGFVVNPQFGLLVNGDYEYLDYGNYIINSKEFNMDTETWSYVCYDKMLFSMVKYRGLSNVQYPITIKQFINKLCDKVGLEFEDSEFVNQDQLIYEDLYKNRDVTYRDIFDEISKVVAGNLLINDNDKLKVGYVNETNDIINEDYLKDTNVKMSEKIGIINSVAILDSESNLQFVAEDTQSIKENQMTRVTVTDNLIAMNGETQEIANNILNKLNGLYYYANDFETTGVCYYDYLDLFNVEARGNIYQCLLLNNEITITQGIEEHIFTEKFEELETSKEEYTTSVMTNKQASLKINQQEAKIEARVEKDGIISAINQSAEEIQIQADKIKLEGYTTINDGFSIDENGNMIANNGTFNGLINAGKIAVSGYTETNPYISVGENFEDPTKPYGVYIWDNGISAIDYRGDGNIPLIRTEQIGGGYAELKGNVVNAFGFNNVSLAEKKKDFELLNSGLEVLKNIDIYKYHYKGSTNKKKKIGIVIGDKYKYSKEITSEDNTEVDLYSFVSVCCKAIQEQQQEIEELKEMIKNGKH